MRVLALLALLALPACNGASSLPGAMPETGDVLATVNGKHITSSMVDAVLRSLPTDLRRQVESQGAMDQVVESLVLSELMYQEAMKRKLYEQPEVKEQLALAERNALADALLKQVVDQRLTEDRIQKYYQDHLVQYSKPQLRLADLVVSSKEEAEQLAAQARQGADFAQLVREHSLDKSSAVKGGDLGWLDVAQFTDQVRGQLSSAQKGDVVGPLDLGGQFFIFKVLDRRDKRPLEDVKDEIRSQLEEQIRNEFMDELRQQAVVVESYKQKGGANAALPPLVPPEADQAPGQPGGAQPAAQHGGQQGAAQPQGAPPSEQPATPTPAEQH